MALREERVWMMHLKRSVNESEKKYVMGIFVDFQGAFDNVEWTAVLDRMREIECDDLAMWVNYFRDRKVCVTSENDIVWKNVKKDSQGSICGPTV